jgi:hypothetical protein
MLVDERQSAQIVLKVVYRIPPERIADMSIGELQATILQQGASYPSALRTLRITTTPAFLAEIEKMAGALSWAEVASLEQEHSADSAFLAALKLLENAGQLPCAVVEYLYLDRINELRQHLRKQYA